MYRHFVKPVLDTSMACLFLIGGIPLFLLIFVVLYRYQHRPVLFRQLRMGKKGKPFLLWKFRTLPVETTPPVFSFPEIPGHFLFPDPPIGSISSIQQFLRKSGLDELPQLLMIVKGEMSFVGPRPEMVELASRYSRLHQQRLEVRPGITGLAQIRGRDQISYRHKIRYDLFYIRNQSFLLDSWILWESTKLFLKSWRVLRHD